GACPRPSRASRSRKTRNAASVLPEPVGATTSALRPAASAGHARSWARVGRPKVSSNQPRATGPRTSRASEEEVTRGCYDLATTGSSRAGHDGVPAGAAPASIPAGTAVEGVVPAAAEQNVVPRSSEQDVVSAVGEDAVVPAQAADHVVPPGSVQSVLPVRSDDRARAPRRTQDVGGG